MANFFKAFFCCNTANEVLDFEEQEKEKEKEQTDMINSSIFSNNTSSETPLNSKSLIDDKYYLPLERELLAPITKEKILKFINSLEENTKGFKLVDTPNLKLYVNKDGSSLSRETYLGCALYSISKVDLYKDSTKHYTLKELNDFFINPTKRMSWDKGVYQMEILSTLNEANDDISTVILHITFNSPIVGISKRDMIEKSIIFSHDQSLYCFQSSIEEKLSKEINDPGEEVVRAIAYINSTRIWEDEEKYFILSYNQTDLKLFIPEALLQMAGSFTVKKFYNNYFQAVQYSLNK